MQFSVFGEKFTQQSGISELMEDLAILSTSSEKIYMLGGGNPAQIPEINEIWRQRLREIAEDEDDFTSTLTRYDSAQGNFRFMTALANLLSKEYGWEVGPENICLTNGSQNGMFVLFNLFGGLDKKGNKRKVMLPLCPEYVGYADQLINDGCFLTQAARIEEIGKHEFKYYVDFNNLNIPENVAALCVSRPTNPTGNVITGDEINKLAEIAKDRDIPLIIDNAYGAPFPNIIFEDVKPVWNENIILSMSLSKIGLPSTRTGIIIAKKEIISALSTTNAIVSLANGTLGQNIVRPLVETGKILEISKEIVRPFYQKRSRDTIDYIKEKFAANIDYRIHKSEGAIFLWLWFKNLKITSRELYERLKKRNVLVLPSEFFFFGLDHPWDHSQECIRINYSGSPEDVQMGIDIIAEEAGKEV
ncbi:MAG: valine--pyruvate transaminase [Desulfotalea sp.]